MIKLIDTYISFGTRPLLDNVSWALGDNDRVALVGENGSGKTTLLKIMAGIMGIERGKVEKSKGLSIGYLPQEEITHAGRTLYEEARSALEGLLSIRREIKSIESRLNEGGLSDKEQQDLIHRLSELMERFEISGGYEMDASVSRVLSGLGFSEDEFSRPVESFSGGWQMRIALAKLLLQETRVLLLDEPTNHLDLEARNWLEEFLSQYPGAYIIVSHDRYFIDVTTERIVEIESGRLTPYRGDYAQYLEEKERKIEAAWEAYERQQDEIKRLQAFINRYRADKKRMGQVGARKKMLERIDPLDMPRLSKPVHFNFPDPPRGPRELLRLEGVVKNYSEKTVLSGVDLQVYRGEKIAVVGHNGAGKSTLLEILAGMKKTDSGLIKRGEGAKTAVFTQDAGMEFDPDDTVMDALAKDTPLDMYPSLRSILGAFLFSGDDVDKKVRVLSGGEKSRLALARLLLRPANLLILDEPTNHLDIRAKEVLMRAFRNYKGALVFVAHDRYFLEDFPGRIIEVEGGKATSYIGDYSDYLRAKKRQKAAQESTPAREIIQEAAGQGRADEGISYDRAAEKAERIRRRQGEKERIKIEKKRKKRLERIEKDIHENEEKLKEIEACMSDPGAATDYMRLMELEKEKHEVSEKLSSLYEEWSDLESKTPEHDKKD